MTNNLKLSTSRKDNLNNYNESLNIKFYGDGRSCIYRALIENEDVKTWYLPKFLCESITLPFKVLNKKILIYDISDELKIIINDNIIPENFKETGILCIDYFGLRLSDIKRNQSIIDRFSVLIIDRSQSFPQKLDINVANKTYYIYNLKKIFKIASGAYILPTNGIDYKTENSYFHFLYYIEIIIEKVLFIIDIKKIASSISYLGKMRYKTINQRFIFIGLDKISNYIIKKLNLNNEINNRINTYDVIYKELLKINGKNFQLVKRSNNLPIFFPLIFTKSCDALLFIKHCNKFKIELKILWEEDFLKSKCDLYGKILYLSISSINIEKKIKNLVMDHEKDYFVN
jgi:hypothetical protein